MRGSEYGAHGGRWAAMRYLIAIVMLAACAGAAAEPPPVQREISSWADGASFALAGPRDCRGIEEEHFGAVGSVCWSAKSKAERPPKGSRMFPRIEITVASYGGEAKAKARMARFREVPKPLQGAAGKAYPLRAGFRVGARVIVVTTDAFTFERDAYRAAAGLAKATGGTELTCWSRCEP
jgi:hypothetical protein